MMWSKEIYYAHMAYYLVICVIDSTLLYFLCIDTKDILHEISAIKGKFQAFLEYTLLGGISRVLYMNLVMLIMSIGWFFGEEAATPDFQNFMFTLKFNFGFIFLMDLLLSKVILFSPTSVNQSLML